MSDTVLTTVLVFGLIFWLILPIPAKFLEIDNYPEVNKENMQYKEVTPLNFLGIAFDGLAFYGKMILLTLPNIPLWISSILFILKILNLLGVILIIRG